MTIKISMADAKEHEPKIPWHPLLISSGTGDQRFCAYSHCRGECGFPALFLRRYFDMSNDAEAEEARASQALQDNQGRYYREYKAHGSMVACGPVWQQKPWDGERVYLPEEYGNSYDMWWR